MEAIAAVEVLPCGGQHQIDGALHPQALSGTHFGVFQGQLAEAEGGHPRCRSATRCRSALSQ
jgi:hypothetical protein